LTLIPSLSILYYDKLKRMGLTNSIMAPVAVPTMDDLKLEDPKVEKKPDEVNQEEGDDDDDDDEEAGGETGATGGMHLLLHMKSIHIY
jgi:hypothetical protein